METENINIEQCLTDDLKANLKKNHTYIETLYKIIRIAIIATLVLLMINMIAAMNSIQWLSKIVGILVVLGIIVGGGSVYLYNGQMKIYGATMRRHVIPKLLAQMDSNAKYIPNDMVPRETIDMANVELTFDTVGGSDYIVTTRNVNYRPYILQFSSITTSFSDPNMNIVEQKIRGAFEGIFINAKMLGVSYPGEINIRKNQNVLDRINKKIREKSKQKVELESVSFEESHDVYSTEEIDVRRILTPATMEKITKIENEISNRFEIGIVGENIFMIIPYSKFLTIYNNEKLIDNEKLNKDINLIKAIYEVSDLLVDNIEKITIV